MAAALTSLLGHGLLDYPYRNVVLFFTIWALVGLLLAFDRVTQPPFSIGDQGRRLTRWQRLLSAHISCPLDTTEERTAGCSTCSMGKTACAQTHCPPRVLVARASLIRAGYCTRRTAHRTPPNAVSSCGHSGPQPESTSSLRIYWSATVAKRKIGVQPLPPAGLLEVWQSASAVGQLGIVKRGATDTAR